MVSQRWSVKYMVFAILVAVLVVVVPAASFSDQSESQAVYDFHYRVDKAPVDARTMFDSRMRDNGLNSVSVAGVVYIRSVDEGETGTVVIRGAVEVGAVIQRGKAVEFGVAGWFPEINFRSEFMLDGGGVHTQLHTPEGDLVQNSVLGMILRDVCAPGAHVRVPGIYGNPSTGESRSGLRVVTSDTSEEPDAKGKPGTRNTLTWGGPVGTDWPVDIYRLIDVVMLDYPDWMIEKRLSAQLRK